MQTRTSHRYAKPPGGIDRLNVRFLDFAGDLPPAVWCATIPGELHPVTCNDFKAMNAQSTVSTFVEDYYLERHWNRPEVYASRFAQCRAVMAPDYSLLVGMPETMQRWQVFRNRMMGHIFAQHGCRVVPTVSWSDKASFSYCFNGLPPGCDVAVSTTGATQPEHVAAFLRGYEAMQAALAPRRVLMQCTYRLRHHFEADNVVFMLSHFDNRREAQKQSHGRT